VLVKYGSSGILIKMEAYRKGYQLL